MKKYGVSVVLIAAMAFFFACRSVERADATAARDIPLVVLIDSALLD